MPLYPIVLIAVLLAWDGGLRLGPDDGWSIGAWMVAALACGPVLVLVGLTQVGLLWCDRRLARGDTPRAILVAERLAHSARLLILVNHAVAVLVFGWLGTVRDAMGDLILLDELVTIGPPLLGYLGTWWAYYPIERRIRDAVLLRRLDLGQPVYPAPSRGRYVLMQARLHLLLLLVPLMVILTLSEIINLSLAPWSDREWFVAVADLSTLAAGLTVFVFAPLMARWVLGVVPMPDGPIHDDLLTVCRAHKVKVRRLLVWKTDGSMLNAAVMGVFGWLRYVLLTDALLETLARRQVRAVMAHEIGHIRRHHMPWLLATLFATILATSLIFSFVLFFFVSSDVDPALDAQPWVDFLGTAVAVLVLFMVFGWVSRRFERQADTFAVQHLSRWPSPSENESDPQAQSRTSERAGETITVESVQTMQQALHLIARLHAVAPTRHSWRHGSIAWRSAYLASLIGRDASTLPIDRQVRWIKLAAAIVLGLAGAYLFLGP